MCSSAGRAGGGAVLVPVRERRAGAAKPAAGRSCRRSYVLAKAGGSSLPAHAGTGSRKQRLVPQCAFSHFPVAASQPSLKRPPPAPSRPSLMWMHA